MLRRVDATSFRVEVTAGVPEEGGALEVDIVIGSSSSPADDRFWETSACPAPVERETIKDVRALAIRQHEIEHVLARRWRVWEIFERADKRERGAPAALARSHNGSGSGYSTASALGAAGEQLLRACRRSGEVFAMIRGPSSPLRFAALPAVAHTRCGRKRNAHHSTNAYQ